MSEWKKEVVIAAGNEAARLSTKYLNDVRSKKAANAAMTNLTMFVSLLISPSVLLASC